MIVESIVNLEKGLYTRPFKEPKVETLHLLADFGIKKVNLRAKLRNKAKLDHRAS